MEENRRVSVAGRSRSLRGLVGALALAVVLPAAAARAHPALDQARARFDEADFPGVLQALADAEQRTDLTATDVEALLELRAIASVANGDPAMMQGALASLASIAPDHALGPDAPPEVVQAFERIRSHTTARVGLAVVAERHGDRVLVRARVENDPTSIVGEVRTMVRVGRAPWRPAPGTGLTVTARPGQSIEYYATAVGPGGAPLATDGSPEHPSRLATPAGSSAPDGNGSGGVSPWIWVAIGALALGAGVTIALVATRPESDITRPLLPSIALD